MQCIKDDSKFDSRLTCNVLKRKMKMREVLIDFFNAKKTLNSLRCKKDVLNKCEERKNQRITWLNSSETERSIKKA